MRGGEEGGAEERKKSIYSSLLCSSSVFSGVGTSVVLFALLNLLLSICSPFSWRLVCVSFVVRRVVVTDVVVVVVPGVGCVKERRKWKDEAAVV